MSFLVLLTFKITLLFSVAWFAAALLRRRSAALRHQAWAAAILISLGLPVVQDVTPSWHLPAAVSRAPLQHPVLTAASPAAVRVTALPGSAWRRRGLVWIWWIWGAGAIAMLLRLLLALAQLYRAGSRARPVLADPEFRKAAEMAASLAAPPALRLLGSHSRLAMPLTWGMFRPKILLPANAMEWSGDRLRLVLTHELAHVARHDWILRLCGELACALYWFHPFAWLASRSLRQESERACDDLVLSSGIHPPDYADELVALARTLDKPARAWSAALAMARPSNFERRLLAMLNPSIDRRPASARTRMMTGAISLCLLLSLASMRAPGQGLAGTYSGAVFDPSGAVVPRAGVSLINDTATPPVKETVVTDAAGKFQFTNLSAGQYTLTVTAPGFQTTSISVELPPGLDATRNVTLDLRGPELITRVTAPGAPRAQQALPPTPIRVGGNVQTLRLIQKVEPEYPATAQAAGIDGTVKLEAVVGKDGSVINIRVLSPAVNVDLVRAAVSAVRQWRFAPTLLNGEPVETSTEMSVEFSLQQ